MALKNFDRFKIINEIEKRVCYTFYEAEDSGNGKIVSIKALDETRAKDKHSVFNFLNGARVASLLDHSNICKVYHFGSDLGRYFIASENISYEPFRSLIKPELALSFDDLMEIFVRIGKTLRYAHLQGVIHGLLSPDTIFINSDGNIKIDDFGFNWYSPQIFQRTDKDALQMAQYISPECYEQQNVDGRVDIYSLGIVLFNLVTGAPPFKSNAMSMLQKHHLKGELPAVNLVDKGLPQEMESILQRAITIKEETRFLNFKDFLDSLELLRRGNLDPIQTPEEALEAEQHEYNNYFDDEPYNIDYKAKAGRSFFISPQKLTLIGSAMFLLLILFLVVNNYLPLPFGEDDESGIVAEELLSTIDEQRSHAGRFSEPTLNQEVSLSSDSLVNAMNDSVIAAIAGPMSLGRREDTSTNNSNHVGTSSTEELPAVEEKIAADKPKEKPAAEPPPKVTSSKTAPKPEPKKQSPVVSAPVTEPPKAADEPVANARSAKATVMVQSQNLPVEAFVFIDNQFKGKTNPQGFFEIPGLEIDKTYTVKISKEGHATLTRQFTALGKTPVLNFDISARQDIYGTLILEALPKADSILVDGKLYKGQSPLQLTLQSGDHKVRFVNKSLGKSHEQMVSLKVGEVQRVKHNFAQAEFGKIAVSLRNAAQYGFGYVYVDGKLWDGVPNTTPIELRLPAGSHTIEVRREGFNAVPRDIIVEVEKDQTKYVSFTFMKN